MNKLPLGCVPLVEIGLFELSLESRGLPMPVREYRFALPRRWRVDYAWLGYKLAVEIEGGCWIKGRHTRGIGFLKDMEKYNTLTMIGWHLLRFTPQEVKKGKAARLIADWFDINLRSVTHG